jgi:hypothetical protein
MSAGENGAGITLVSQPRFFIRSRKRNIDTWALIRALHSIDTCGIVKT